MIAGRYRVEARLGRGGMGAVYRAFDSATGRQVALKTLELTDERARALFEQEYATLASIQHPRLIAAYDFGVDGGRRYYTMELIGGDDVARLAPLPPLRVCEVLRDVATSLALLHAQGVLHRDVSPSNVRLDDSGRAKLLDFGAATVFGVAHEIIGTPEAMAPEVLREQRLDERADLFSLGTLAYFALTGRAAYPIRELREAESAWCNPPPPPSRLVPNVPRALDQLVLSLLSIDPKGRPSSAAEVIDRVSAIANLDDNAFSGPAEGRLQSPALIGRDAERKQLRAQLAKLNQGTGSALVIEAEAGMGRSRLVHELAIEARIAGLTALHVAALAHPGPLGVLAALGRALLAQAPAEAHETLPKHFAVLGRAFPELAQHSAPGLLAAAPQLPRDPTERRARIQSALCAWLLDVAAQRPLLVVIDDAHAADPASASALVVLAHAAESARLMLVATCVRQTQAELATRQLARFGTCLPLSRLTNTDIDRLVAALFGETPHRARLVPWLIGVANGSPGHCIDLLRGLFDRGVIRFEGGAWQLPPELPEHALPRSQTDALAARVAQLPAAAMKLLRLFALEHRALPRRVCFRLLREEGAGALFAALDVLVARNLLESAHTGYRLAQPTLASVALDGVGEPEIEALHRQLGMALLESDPELQANATLQRLGELGTEQLGTALTAGWHLSRGDEPSLGRKLLRNAGIELTLRGEGLVEAVPALAAALEIYRAQGRSRYEQLALLAPLTLAGAYLDWRLSYRYGDETLTVLAEVTGMALARRLRRWLGGRLGLVIALGWAFVLFRCTRRSLSARSFREVFLGFVALGSATLGNCLILQDQERSERVARLLEPLGLFPSGHPTRVMHEFHQVLREFCMGRASEGAERARVVLDWLRTPGHKHMPEEARVQLEVGVCGLIGQCEAMRTDGSVHEMLDMLEHSQTSVSRQTAASIRRSYFAHRGELTRMNQSQREVDLLAAQAGSIWREDLIAARTLWLPFMLCEDVIALKRVASDLERLSLELPGVGRFRDAARACYLAERQRHGEALQRYEHTLASESQNGSAHMLRYSAVYARILRGAGRCADAKRVCDRQLAALPARDNDFVMVACLRLEQQLALAGLGQLHEAATGLEQFIENQAQHDNPLVHALAHKARAQVALLAGDTVAFAEHATAMQCFCMRADNPALLAQYHRLLEEARAAGLTPDVLRSSPRLQLPAADGVLDTDARTLRVPRTEREASATVRQLRR